MTFDTNLWNNTKAEGGFADSVTPLGSHTITVIEAGLKMTGALKDVPTIIVEYRAPGGEQWADVKTLTTAGKIKSAKILMRDLGLDPDTLNSPEQIHAALKAVEGGYYDVTNKESDTINPDTGKRYVNTYINGKASATTPVAPSPTIETGAVPAATLDDTIPF